MPVFLLALATIFAGPARAEGEPAEAFLKQLRAAGYFDMAIVYLDRLPKYPGVDPELIEAVALEKAQTFIDAAVASRDAGKRDQNFARAESELREFTQQASHPRISEARAQLGRLQMVRASQLLGSDPDESKRKAARESYLAASKTFDAIVKELTEKLSAMQGQKIDSSSDPEAAARRDRYRGEFLQAKFDAADTKRLAAETFDDPAKQGKQLLEQALAAFKDLYDKYGKRYAQGATAMYYMGRCEELLGNQKGALDNYTAMLERDDADPLREAKSQSISGAIRIWLAGSPPKYQQGIDLGQELLNDVRRNEQSLPSVQEMRLQVAKAYLAKSEDKAQKGAEKTRAKSKGRQLLVDAGKIPGPHLKEAQDLLSGLGIAETKVELPKAEPPKSFEDAFETARQLLTATENLQQSLAILKQQKNPPAEIAGQRDEIDKQLRESRAIAIQVLRAGLAMINRSSDLELVNQGRQILTYLLYQDKRYRASAAVGSFLAQSSAGTEVGLRGGLLALNSLQLVLAEVPEDQNTGLVDQVDKLGKFLMATWPDSPKAKAAQGVMIRLALSKDRWDDARQLVDEMPASPEKSSFQRLLGQLLYNRSVVLGREGNDTEARQYMDQAEKDLLEGLDSGSGKMVDPEVMQPALVLSKIYLKNDDAKKALEILDHPKYGPIKLLKTQGPPNDLFQSDLYSTELQVLVQRMIAADQDPAALLDRAIATMEKLRKSFGGPDGQDRLTQIYLRMATDIRSQLDEAPPDRREKLIAAFRVFLKRIADTTEDAATLRWVGQTLMQMGESAMLPTDAKASGQSAELIQAAVDTFEGLTEKSDEKSLTLNYQVARAQRLLGNYKSAIDGLESVLREKPMMLDAQTEAALAYEQWAGEINPKYAANAYQSALSGARPGDNGQNTIWGWGKISQLTSRDPKFRDQFFEARYHVALTRFLMGKAMKSKPVMEKAITDITKVAALYPDLGGKELREKYDLLLKEIQRTVGQDPEGLPPAPATSANARFDGTLFADRSLRQSVSLHSKQN